MRIVLLDAEHHLYAQPQFKFAAAYRGRRRRLGHCKCHAAVEALVLDYRTALVARELAPATVNVRLAALRSLVKLARTLGLVPWTLESFWFIYS